jgi:hypothetical protein
MNYHNSNRFLKRKKKSLIVQPTIYHQNVLELRSRNWKRIAQLHIPQDVKMRYGFKKILGKNVNPI